MKILSRYLLRQNLTLLSISLCAGSGIYLLADIFERLDNFISAGVDFKTTVVYFVVKLPLIISQILPAVFLVAILIQLSLMARSRELMALQASGISFGRLVSFFLVYSLCWSVLQLGFSQFVGVYGEQKAGKIWKEQVRKTQMDRRVLKNVWFKEDRYVVKLDSVMPAKATGEGITVYQIAPDRLEWEKIVRARTFEGGNDGWTLHDVEVLAPDGFVYERQATLVLPLRQDLAAFMVMDPHRDPTQLPLWQLGNVIGDLQTSGSNVESLKTVWHMKLAYAFSLIVMALLALALVSMQESVYRNIAAGLLLTFAYYGLGVVCGSAGQKGLLPPAGAAWAGNIVFFFLAAGRLVWQLQTSPTRQGRAA